MKANRLSCQASIKYWCIPTTFSLYMFIFVGCEFRNVAFEKLSRLSFKETLICRFPSFLVLNDFQSSLSYDPNRVQRNVDSVPELLQKELI